MCDQSLSYSEESPTAINGTQSAVIPFLEHKPKCVYSEVSLKSTGTLCPTVHRETVLQARAVIKLLVSGTLPDFFDVPSPERFSSGNLMLLPGGNRAGGGGGCSPWPGGDLSQSVNFLLAQTTAVRSKRTSAVEVSI